MLYFVAIVVENLLYRLNVHIPWQQVIPIRISKKLPFLEKIWRQQKILKKYHKFYNQVHVQRV